MFETVASKVTEKLESIAKNPNHIGIYAMWCIVG
jgi:hypothetical protein